MGKQVSGHMAVSLSYFRREFVTERYFQRVLYFLEGVEAVVTDLNINLGISWRSSWFNRGVDYVPFGYCKLSSPCLSYLKGCTDN